MFSCEYYFFNFILKNMFHFIELHLKGDTSSMGILKSMHQLTLFVKCGCLWVWDFLKKKSLNVRLLRFTTEGRFHTPSCCFFNIHHEDQKYVLHAIFILCALYSIHTVFILRHNQQIMCINMFRVQSFYILTFKNIINNNSAISTAATRNAEKYNSQKNKTQVSVWCS